MCASDTIISINYLFSYHLYTKRNVIIQRWENLKEFDEIEILRQTHHFEQLSLIFITAAQPWLVRDKAIYV